VVEGSDGALYGTTFSSGPNGGGTVFKVNKDGSGFRILHSFSVSSGDGRYPTATVVEGSDGALYGTTHSGGTNDAGTVFKLSKDGSDYAVVHHFTRGPGDGWVPEAPLVEGSDGALYGTTTYGGITNPSPDGFGTVFKLNKDGSAYTVLYSFGGFTSDGGPSGLVEGSDGALYGTTVYGGYDSVGGTVFRLNKDGSGYLMLHSFGGFDFPGDGLCPQGGWWRPPTGCCMGRRPKAQTTRGRSSS
jgi:uncharacterized repeat protein (TIGR03803 family)